MISGQHRPEPAENGQPSPTPFRVFYGATIVQAGCNQAGDQFRTHHATVTAGPKGSDQ